MVDLEPFVAEEAVPYAAGDLSGLVAAAAHSVGRVVADRVVLDRCFHGDHTPAVPAGEITLLNTATGAVATVIDARHVLACAGLVDPACDDVDAALGAASFDSLVTFASRAAELLDVVKEADNAVRYELPLRLDARGSWTVREAGHVVNAPSPEAGTQGYDSDLLRAATARLVAEGVIEREAADRALEAVQRPALVPYATLRQLLAALNGELDQAAHDEMCEALATHLEDEQRHWRPAEDPEGEGGYRGVRDHVPPRRRATVKPIAPPR